MKFRLKIQSILRQSLEEGCVLKSIENLDCEIEVSQSWKTYKELASVCSISSVEVESFFSSVARMKTRFRRRLTLSSVSVLVRISF